MNNKETILNKIESNLLSTKRYKITWFVILGLSILYFIMLGIMIGFRYWKHAPYTQTLLNLNHSYVLGAEVTGYMSLVIIIGPYLFLAGCWISGLNNTARSKHFHLTLWIIYAIVYFFIIISLILIFRAGFYL